MPRIIPFQWGVLAVGVLDHGQHTGIGDEPRRCDPNRLPMPHAVLLNDSNTKLPERLHEAHTAIVVPQSDRRDTHTACPLDLAIRQTPIAGQAYSRIRGTERDDKEAKLATCYWRHLGGFACAERGHVQS